MDRDGCCYAAQGIQGDNPHAHCLNKLVKEEWLRLYKSIVFPLDKKLDHEDFGCFGMFCFNTLFAA